MGSCDHWRWNCLAKRFCALPLLLWLTQVTPAGAQDQTIAQLVHKTWTGKDGAPLGIGALAQTPQRAPEETSPLGEEKNLPSAPLFSVGMRHARGQCGRRCASWYEPTRGSAVSS
jgi:hypothetical protein